MNYTALHRRRRCVQPHAVPHLLPGFLDLFISVCLHLALLFIFLLCLHCNRFSMSFLKSIFMKLAISSMALFFFFLAGSEDMVKTRNHLSYMLDFHQRRRKKACGWKLRRHTLESAISQQSSYSAPRMGIQRPALIGLILMPPSESNLKTDKNDANSQVLVRFDFRLSLSKGVTFLLPINFS